MQKIVFYYYWGLGTFQLMFLFWQSGPSDGLTDEVGINYLALNDLFQLSARRKDIMKYDMHVQMVEIYNEQVRDLLAEETSVTKYPFSIAKLLTWDYQKYL